MTKRCYKCLDTKPLTEFHKDTSKAGGYRGKCKACVRDYMANRADETWARKAEFKAREAGAAAIERVSRRDVFERDGYVCQLCTLPTEGEPDHDSPLGPTVDHATPLSRGGDHTFANCITAHRVCNDIKAVKSKRLLDVYARLMEGVA